MGRSKLKLLWVVKLTNLSHPLSSPPLLISKSRRRKRNKGRKARPFPLKSDLNVHITLCVLEMPNSSHTGKTSLIISEALNSLGAGWPVPLSSHPTKYTKESSLSTPFVFQAQLEELERGRQPLYLLFSIKGSPLDNKGQKKQSDGAASTAGISADEGWEAPCPPLEDLTCI